MKAKDIDPRQDDLALKCVASHALFPGRTVLRVHEVAEALEISIQHVIDLINEYRDTGGQSGLLAICVANGRSFSCMEIAETVSRGAWRVPVTSFDDYVRRAAGVEGTAHTDPSTTKNK
ncbi:hypothetical protein CfE428DRAFT_5821 [Chthoniobacter flavus Ellin428]|uniref:Uncharacterized protein n=1 Tax=Chthoniobacter flavus Ellin428 TaxID=497964 RepID=B4DA81_9BACT|nr:hypothetical protein [Chthoniobacter flavus]EDY16708.1 hypothetical protein CfE428DRAFT_5821 [Chthoniobacter flavus Ellin428]TCO87274.1 hypothetical protein EV701_123111 [Chthoniobacter flavus]